MNEEGVNKKKNIYFLHIAGTGGKAFKEYIINPLLNKNENEENSGRHNGWSYDIDDNTYVMCILRDPVKRACGFYLHFVFRIEDGHDKFKFGSGVEISKLKSLFLDYYRQAKHLYNFQSKNLMGPWGLLGDYPKLSSMLDITVNEDLLEKRLGRINFLISQDILQDDPQYVANALAKDLIIPKIRLEEISRTKHSNSFSDKLYKSLTEEEKQEIQDLNKIDYKIYSQLRLKESKHVLF